MLFSFFLLYTYFKKSKLNKFQNESNYLLVMHIFFFKLINQKDAHKFWAYLKRVLAWSRLGENWNTKFSTTSFWKST